MTIGLIAGLAVLGFIIAIAAVQRRGPRVTQIETTRVRKDGTDA